MDQQIEGLSVTLQNLLTQFLLFLPKLITAVVIFLVGLYLANLITSFIRKGLEKRQVDPEARQVIIQIARWSLIVVVAITALQQVDFNLSAFVASLGIIGFTVGFALKDVSENFVAGLLLLLQKPFELGDVVHVADYRGRVQDVSLRATEIMTMEGHNVILPNGMVYSNPILNYTRSPLTRIEVGVGVAYESDLEYARETALEAVRALPQVLEDPEPYVVFHTFGGSSIDFTVFYWIDSRETNQFRATDQAVPAIKQAFAEVGIDIPFPIRTVYMHQQ